MGEESHPEVEVRVFEDPVPKEIVSEIERRYQQILNHEAWKLFVQILDVRSTYRIFFGNHEVLISHLTKITTAESLKNFWSYEVEKKSKDMFIFEVQRLLFNYLSSAFMVIDHMRGHSQGKKLVAVVESTLT